GVSGALVTVSSADEVDVLRSVGIPFVCMTHMPTVPMVANDNRQVGQMGARHLIDQGYKSLYFIGPPTRDYIAERLRGFAAAAEQAGVRWQVLNAGAAVSRIDPAIL